MEPSRGLIGAFKGFSHFATALVLVQAMLAGVFISREEVDATDVHEMVGNLIFMVVVVQLVLAFLVRGWSKFNLWIWVTVLLAAVVAQTGLGYAGRDETFPVAIHVPLGVLIFGVATMISTLAFLEDRT
ncbi:MAG: hypothetical protein ABIP58_08625 [Dehalococcoidia bacterium]